jgi:F-type H+-transporting ATPase subunit alpha
LLDPLPLAVILDFRRGLGEAIDRGAADVVQSIQETGMLDEAGKQTLQEALKRYAQALTPVAPS